jgi:hypothetical protein
MLHIFLTWPLRPTYPPHPMYLDLTTSVISEAEYRLWSSSLNNFLQHQYFDFVILIHPASNISLNERQKQRKIQILVNESKDIEQLHNTTSESWKQQEGTIFHFSFDFNYNFNLVLNRELH